MKSFFKHLKGDAFGGITAGIVALPLALAFGVSSGLGPSAGLYGAILIAFFAALFGGTPTQISGPTAPMTAVTIGVVAAIVAGFDGDLQKALPIILTVFLLAGLMQIGLGILGVGKYIRYIPYPVVSGFMTAIGVMILITQLQPLFGYNASEDETLIQRFIPQAEEVVLQKNIQKQKESDFLVIQDVEEAVQQTKATQEDAIKTEAINLAKNHAKGVVGTVKVLPYAIKNIRWLEVALALATILIIYGFKRITTAVPSTLVALVIVSSVAYFVQLEYLPIEEIPARLPKFNGDIFTSFSLASISPYIFAAISLAFLGAIDSLLTSVVADNMTKTNHKPNKELIGQGIGNTVASLFGGIPGAGATIRTVVNIKAGGKTKLSGMIAGVLLLFILLALGPIASKIPAAVLAGILITVGIGVMDYKGLKAIPNLPKDINLLGLKLSSEVLIMIIVLILSVFWNLINAVGIGLVLSSLVFMKKMGDFTARRSKVLDLKATEENEVLWNDEINFPENLKEEIFIKHLNGPLFFGYTSEFQQLTAQIPNGIKVHLVGLQKQPRFMLERIDIIPDLIAEEGIFKSFDSCISYLKTIVSDTQ